MAKKRVSPPEKSLAQRQVESTEDMAQLAAQSGFPNVTMNLTNLAQRRRTAFETAQQKAKTKAQNVPSTKSR